MTLSCPDIHLICTNDLSSLTICLNLLICELAFIYVCIAGCNLSAYTFVMCKTKATYLTIYALVSREPRGSFFGVIALVSRSKLLQNKRSLITQLCSGDNYD